MVMQSVSRPRSMSEKIRNIKRGRMFPVIVDAVVRVARLVWEAEGEAVPLTGSSDAVGVLGRWLNGADAGRAEDALLASYHLRDKGLLELAPAIARWVGAESAAPHVRRLLGMAPVKELRPVLAPALAARLREEPDPHGHLRSACADILEHLGLDEDLRRMADLALPGPHRPRRPHRRRGDHRGLPAELTTSKPRLPTKTTRQVPKREYCRNSLSGMVRTELSRLRSRPASARHPGETSGGIADQVREHVT